MKARKTLTSAMVLMGVLLCTVALTAHTASSAELSRLRLPKTKISAAIMEQDARLTWLEEQNLKLITVVNYLARENEEKSALLLKLEEDNEALREHIRELERKIARRRR